jgi:hypothetical protein
LIVHVDEIMLTGNDNEEIQRLKKHLASKFEIKDLGNLKYFLGIKVARSRHCSSSNGNMFMLKETGMLGCKIADNPIEPNKKFKESDGSSLVDKGRYQRLLGRLIYLSHTHPDIAYAVSVVS